MHTITQNSYKTIFSEKVVLCPNCLWPIELCACQRTFMNLFKRFKAIVMHNDKG